MAAGIIPTILAARSYYVNGHVVTQAIPALVLGASCGATLGSRLALAVSDEHLRLGFSAAMIALAIRTFLTI